MNFVQSCLQHRKPIGNLKLISLYFIQAGFIQAAQDICNDLHTLLQGAALSGQLSYIREHIDADEANISIIAYLAGLNGHCQIADWLITEKDASVDNVISGAQARHVAYAEALKEKYHV